MQVPTGDAFTAHQRQDITRAILDAERQSGLTFSVHVGESLESSREYAERLHAALDDPGRSVLVHVDPAARSLDIVTGALIRGILPNRDVALAAITMQSTFANGDLVGGLVAGVRQLGEMARQPRTLHTDTP